MICHGIPKKAVKALIEHCNRFGEKTGRSGAEVFRDYLEWMKKHADYFFSFSWPPKYVPTGTWLTSEECGFIDGSESYEEERERFTVVLLRRNLSLEGFKADFFEEEFDFYGRMFCGYCAVPAAMYLRKYLENLKESNAQIEDKIKLEPNDTFWEKLYSTRFSADSIRLEKMAQVELNFLEIDGEAEGKVCPKHNKYVCPYGSKSWKLIRLGRMVKNFWRLVEFYDKQCNRSQVYKQSPSEDKGHNFCKSIFLDVTSQEDMLEALEDGRIDKIAVEFKRHSAADKHS